MTDVMHKFEIIFHSYDQTTWIGKMLELIPSGFVVEGTKDGTRHVHVYARKIDVDLVRLSVMMFKDHIQQVTNAPVIVMEQIGWGDIYGTSPDGLSNTTH